MMPKPDSNLNYSHEYEVQRIIARWETDVVLSDGGTVKIRPIVPDDSPLIVKLHATLSVQTIYFRFFSPIPTLSDTMLSRFVNVDYTDRMAFVAMLGNSLVAVARYDRLPGRSEAEVAFLVSDAHQGRGLGTIMLEMLSARASEAGITRFIADTLPENQRMLRVFHEAGYKDTKSYQDGVVRVVFDIKPTNESIQKMHERERQAVSRSISKILAPRSIAIVGASTTNGSIGNVLFKNILESSYAGRAYPVNQHASSVSSVRAYASILEIPDEIDLAVIVVPADDVMKVVSEAAEKQVGGLVIISSGFSETGPEGIQRERDLVRYARGNGMRIVGPNCMGVANTAMNISLNATLAPHALLPGRSSLIAHSGALGLAIVEEARRRGIGLSTFVSSGNRADVSGNDLLHFWEQDQNTDVILLYLESFGNPRSFVRIARRVSKSKPIVAVKAKRVTKVPPSMELFQSFPEQSSNPDTSGKLGAPSLHYSAEFENGITVDEAVDAMFTHTGVLRVNSLEELFTLGHALETQPPPKGPNVAILSNRGGPSALAQDSLERAGLKLAQLDQKTVATLERALPSTSKIGNPVELPTDANPKDYEIALQALIQDGNTDSVLVLFVPTVTWDHQDVTDLTPVFGTNYNKRSKEIATTKATETAKCIANVALSQPENKAKPVLANFLALPSVLPALKRPNGEVPLFSFPELAAQSLGRMWEYGQWRSKPEGEFLIHKNIDRSAAGSAISMWLADVPEKIDNLDPRNPITKELKLTETQCQDLLEYYGIHVEINSKETKQSINEKNIELKISIVHDMVFGPFITIQLSGLIADLLNQKSIGVLPLRDLDAKELIASIPGSKIFNGYQDIPPLDVDSLLDLVSRLGRLVENHFEIANVYLQPIILSSTGCNIGRASIRLVDWAAQANYRMRGLS